MLTLGLSGSKLHIVERIIRRVVVLLTGLQTTGDNVYRDIVYPPEALPAISVMQGGDVKRENGQMGPVESDLTINIMVFVKSDQYSTIMNRIRAEIYEALMSSGRLTLSYVDALNWIEDQEPDVSGESETVVIRANSVFMVGYTHSLNSKVI